MNMADTKKPLTRIMSFSGKYEMRNLTVFDIQKQKGKGKLSQTLPASPEEASAAEESGIDWLNVRYDPNRPEIAKNIRDAAPNTFMTFAMPAKNLPSIDETLRVAFDAMEIGADSIMCGTWSLESISALAKANVPAQGHVGLIPRRSTWTGGLKAVGKKFEQSKKVFDDIRALENAGAWAVEVEVIPSKVLEIISPKTKLVTCSIGAGSGGDVQFLFAQDLLGDGQGPFPRHSKQYCNLNEVRMEMQVMRKNAFKQFDQEIKNGLFPSPKFEVKSNYEEIEKLEKYIEKFDSWSVQ